MGIEDETGIVYGIGEQSPFKLSDSISNMISDACTPQIEPDISIRTLEDKTILVVDVVPGKFRPYYLASKGRKCSAYIRINGKSRPADTRKLHELKLEGKNISYDTLQEIGCEYDEKKALDLCKRMKHIAIDACESEEEKLAVKDMTLGKLFDFGVLCRVGKNPYPTHAFDLLTDNTNKASKIQCALFKGKTRDVFIDKKEFNGPIYEQVDDAYHFVLRHIDMGEAIEGEYREVGDNFRVTIFRKVVNEAEKVSNEFVKYVYLFEKAGVTGNFINNIEQVFRCCGPGVPFGQSNVMEWLNCSKSKATNIMKAMKNAEIIRKVTGMVPGKYEFIKMRG